MQTKSSYPMFILLAILLSSCSSSSRKTSEGKDSKTKVVFLPGTYGYDLDFLKAHQIGFIELKESDSKASLILSPDLQGRVLTSSANGHEGKSFGWINYKLIESGVVSDQFNAYGGEERLWFGPEGGPFSIYFSKGKEQVFANWVVPKEIDTLPFDVVKQTPESVSFRKEFSLVNATGTIMDVAVERNIKLLNRAKTEQSLQLSLDTSLNYVAYESENILTNNGKIAWNEKTGFLSIWLLSMFNPSEEGVVFIPFRKGSETGLGKIVTDDYFGKVPADRLVVKDGVLFFKTDGKYRSKIGLSPQRSLPWCGSYDSKNQVLTLLWYSKPVQSAKYVNSRWGDQADPLSGDAVNSYNDGPVADGSVMGPFYEIESSSPAAIMASGEQISHKQRIFHISGNEAQLSKITERIFNLSVTEIKQAFK
ncbi:MAG: hypothetical protein Q8S54_16690 [Bacteroidota bacterium]|nr:hypothetical protein [Bacteroidota bacterium]